MSDVSEVACLHRTAHQVSTRESNQTMPRDRIRTHAPNFQAVQYRRFFPAYPRLKWPLCLRRKLN